MLPNGNLFGSVVGRIHDSNLLARSKLIRKIKQNLPHLYGDSGYPLSTSIIVPFKGTLTQRQKKVNKAMSRLRISVEWGFAKILQLIPFVDFKKNPKIRKEKVLHIKCLR